MKKTFRPKIWLALSLCFLFVLTPTASATQATPSNVPTPKIIKDWSNFSPEDLKLLNTQEYELMKMAMRAKDSSIFENLSAPAKAERVTLVLSSFVRQLWPQKDAEGGTESPGLLGYPARIADTLLDSKITVSPRTMLASVSPKLARTFAQAPGCNDDPDAVRFDLRKPFWEMPLGTKELGDLPGITGFWSGFRNLAYALLTMVLVVFGFLIMLRKNIEPRVTMTITNALPRIAVALVLITFSFAISGLIIDVGRVTDSVIKGTFANLANRNFNIYSMLFEFGKMGLLEPFKPLRKTSYVFRLPVDWKDKNSPGWRCDYNPTCVVEPEQAGSPSFGCKKADGTDCDDYYCSVAGIKVWSCAICFAKEPTIGLDFNLGPWPVNISKKLADYWCITLKDGVGNPFADGSPFAAGGAGNNDDAPDGSPNGPPRGCAFGLQHDDLGNRLMFGKPRGIACCNRKGPPQDAAIQCPRCSRASLEACTCDQSSAFPEPFPRDRWNQVEFYLNVVIIFLIGLLINLLFFITLIQTIFALLFKLINAFAMWFILTIVSPLVFMWGTIPGQEGAIGLWAKHFLASVLTFPIVNFVIGVASVLADSILSVGPDDAITSFPSLMAIGGSKRQILLLIPYGIILITPQIPDILANIIGAKPVGGKGGPDLSKQARKLPIIGGLVG